MDAVDSTHTFAQGDTAPTRHRGQGAAQSFQRSEQRRASETFLYCSKTRASRLSLRGYTLYSLYRTARGLRRWPSLRGTSAWRRRLSKDYTLHGAVHCCESCSSLEAMVSSSKVVATAIVIPNFKHSWACLGGAKSRRPKRP